MLILPKKWNLASSQTQKKATYIHVLWFVFMILMPFTLYLDYKCTNQIVPFDYLYERVDQQHHSSLFHV